MTDFPNNLSKNTVQVYHIPDVQFKSSKRILSINLNHWNSNIPKSLKDWSIQAISDNWKERPLMNELPLLSDIMTLLDILPTELPLELTVANIAYDCYWLRCYKNRWPKKPPLGRNFSEVERLFPEKKDVRDEVTSSASFTNNVDNNKSIDAASNSNHNLSKSSSQKSIKTDRSGSSSYQMPCRENGDRTWKELYSEMHVREYLENLEPENYNPEKIKEITSLFKNYVSTLTLSELKAPTKTDIPDHIPLNAILSSLSRLTELCLCFKQTYVGEKFSWHIFNTTMTDIKILAKGLEHTKLKILRIQNSDINCVKVKMLLKGLVKNEFLRELEFSHCKISDHGTMTIAKFVYDHANVKYLILTNNFIGPNGAKSLAYALTQNSKLITLNLRLNILRSKGGEYLYRSLVKGGRHLRNLILAGCGLNDSNIEIEEMLRCNATLNQLDVSNNRMGEKVGQAILNALKINRTLTQLDIRRCNFTSDTEWEILQAVRKNKDQESLKVQEAEEATTMDEYFSQEFINEFNSVFDNQ